MRQCWKLWRYAVTAMAVIAVNCSQLPAFSQYSAEDAPSALTGGPGTVGTAQYMSTVQSRVERNWAPPKGTTFNTVHVRFKVHKNGSISDVKVVGSSGIASVDEAALAAVKRSTPYPGPAAGLPDPMDMQIALDPPAGSAPSYTPEDLHMFMPPRPPEKQADYPYPQQPAYPAQQPAYPAQQPYPGQPPAYPAQQPDYPQQRSGYPKQQPGYPLQQPTYPAQQPEYPAQQSGYPAQQPAYPTQPAAGYSDEQSSPYPNSPPSSHPYPQPSGYPPAQSPAPRFKPASPPRSKPAPGARSSSPGSQKSLAPPPQSRADKAKQRPIQRPTQPPADLGKYLVGRSGAPRDYPAQVPPATPRATSPAPQPPLATPRSRSPAGQPPPAALAAPAANTTYDLFAFLSDLNKAVRRSWNPPPGAEALRVVARFRVQPDGQLSQLRIDNSSGYGEVDHAALAAILSAVPFSRLPADFTSEVELQMAFGPKGPKAAVVGY